MKNNKVSEILNSVFYIPLLLENNKEFLKYLNLTKEEKAELKKLTPFLKYNLEFIQKGLGDYELLRGGLKSYFELYLKDIFKKLKLTGKQFEFLDYGAGSGIYSKQFLIDNPKSKVHLLDRTIGMKIDFEKTPDWYLDYKEKYDCVLLSELLHCKNLEGQKAIIKSVKHILKPKGLVIINENDDMFMAYRLKRVTNGGNKMTPAEITKLMKGFKLKKQTKINNHNIFLYENI